MAAYGIVRFFPKLGSIMSKVLVATYMFPPILLAIPYSMVMAKLGLVNTRIGLIIVYLSFSVPYAVWMLVGFFKTVPLGIEEAAKVDGANGIQCFFRITLPLILKNVLTLSIPFTLWRLTTFDIVYSMTSGGPGEDTALIAYRITTEAFTNLNVGYASALAMLLFVVMAVFSWLNIRVMNKIDN